MHACILNKPNRDSARHVILLCLLFLVAISGCRKSTTTEANLPFQERYNQVYGADTLQQYDLFLPEGRDHQTEIILVIHGGGWISGKKEEWNYYAQRFCDFGFAAISMNYRLANDSIHYLEMLDDIDSMIMCISRNTDTWGIGSGRIALFGYSAGGHLALLYSYSRDKGQNISSVISLAGPTDVQDSLLWESPGLYNNIVLMTGDPDPADWHPANPVSCISAANAATLLIHGTNDSIVPFSQSVKLNQLLAASFTPVQLLLLEDETHFFSAAATEIFLNATKQFLDENNRGNQLLVP